VSDAFFCDEKGENASLGSTWHVEFTPLSSGTQVVVENSFASLEDLEKILARGFKDGFTMSHWNLDELLKSKAISLITNTLFITDLEKNQLTVSRSFCGSLEKVWKCWTDANVTQSWWAPKPFKLVLKSQDFRIGGRWFYYVEDEKGEKFWCGQDYEKIVPYKSFTAQDYFCDEKGENRKLTSTMVTTFDKISESETKVEVESTYSTVQDLKTCLSMDCNNGFAGAQRQLDDYLKTEGEGDTSARQNGKRKERSSSPERDGNETGKKQKVTE